MTKKEKKKAIKELEEKIKNETDPQCKKELKILKAALLMLPTKV